MGLAFATCAHKISITKVLYFIFYALGPLITDLSVYFMVYCLRDEVNQLKYNDPGIIPSGQTYSFFVLLGINNESDSVCSTLPAVTSCRSPSAAALNCPQPRDPRYDGIFKMHLYSVLFLDLICCGQYYCNVLWSFHLLLDDNSSYFSSSKEISDTLL